MVITLKEEISLKIYSHQMRSKNNRLKFQKKWSKNRRPKIVIIIFKNKDIISTTHSLKKLMIFKKLKKIKTPKNLKKFNKNIFSHKNLGAMVSGKDPLKLRNSVRRKNFKNLSWIDRPVCWNLHQDRKRKRGIKIRQNWINLLLDWKIWKRIKFTNDLNINLHHHHQIGYPNLNQKSA